MAPIKKIIKIIKIIIKIIKIIKINKIIRIIKIFPDRPRTTFSSPAASRCKTPKKLNQK
jgi:hypothetical protein